MKPYMANELSAFFLAYNEEGNIAKLIAKADEVIKKLAKRYELIVVFYRGSTDNTEHIVKKLMKTYPKLRIVYQEKHEKGYGVALKIGIGEARYKHVFYTDSDLQFDVSEIALLLPSARQYPIVTGYRKKRKDPLPRLFISKIYNIIMRNSFGFHVKDIDCAFKIFNKDIFTKIGIQSRAGMVLTEIYAKAKKLGYNIKEVPITHYPRHSGSSIFESKFALVKLSVVNNLLKEMNRLKNELK